MLSDCFSKNLENYLLQVTTPESPLLAQLRQETLKTSPVARMLCGPIEGQLLAMLIQLSGAKRVLEIGTFTGYSALYMAGALPLDGTIDTLEIRADHGEFAKKYFEKSQDKHKITLHLGEAMKTLPTLPGPYDFVFIDADKANYVRYYDEVLPKLIPGGLIVVDNALWRGEVISPQSKEALSIDALNQKASCDQHVQTVMLTVRDGMLLIRKNR